MSSTKRLLPWCKTKFSELTLKEMGVKGLTLYPLLNANGSFFLIIYHLKATDQRISKMLSVAMKDVAI